MSISPNQPFLFFPTFIRLISQWKLLLSRIGNPNMNRTHPEHTIAGEIRTKASTRWFPTLQLDWEPGEKSSTRDGGEALREEGSGADLGFPPESNERRMTGADAQPGERRRPRKGARAPPRPRNGGAKRRRNGGAAGGEAAEGGRRVQRHRSTSGPRRRRGRARRRRRFIYLTLRCHEG